MPLRRMSRKTVTIPGQPLLEPAEDFYLLRRKGIGFIEEMGSRLWSDYNSHDPGITILEALCYALTDLAYRAGWEIADLLTKETPPPAPPEQPFFTAREILTVNPTTPDDFRRLLIDLEEVRNAWVFCKECGCDFSYYAWCEKEGLRLGYRAPEGVAAPKGVAPLGLYEVLVELESDPELGDLNDRKVESASIFHDADGLPHRTLLELRFPEIGLYDREGWELFLGSDDAFADPEGGSLNLRLASFGATRSYDLFSDPLLDEAGRDRYLRAHWRGIFYLTLEVELLPESKKVLFEQATLRLYGDAAARGQATSAGLKALLEQKGTASPLRRYRRKALAQRGALESARGALFSHRNLDEDYCRVEVAGIEEIAVCADVEVKPDADIERVQAAIWFAIERYLNPPVPFYTLKELMDAGVAVEEIFNGPPLKNGFLREEELEGASLRSVLAVSDLVNLLMDLEGVVAVNELQLAKYDAEGNLVRGAADPAWSSDGKPIFDGGKASAHWLLYLAKRRRPRLYLNASRFLFYKNGLPFLPGMDEATDTLNQLAGEGERPKIKGSPDDLPVPAGTFRHPEGYFPLQYSFPLCYGVGPEGLPAQASARRRSQAKQLKGYLLFFEQLLGNALAQIAHSADLFSLDQNLKRSYFVREFTSSVIAGYDEIAGALDRAGLEEMTETLPEFQKRRNRFLDHVMARFGEQFNEYALLLTDLQGEQVALERLIGDKISFLKSYPLVSRDRGRGFNYAVDPCAPENSPGIKRRIELLLGLQNHRLIVVEHLLLRPKFPGDALCPACSEGGCRSCGDEDPYSFRVTFVMPGWLPPFDSNMEMRGFADRTIREQTPSHLLAKICWVGNDGFVEEPDEKVVAELAALLMAKGVTSGGSRPEREEACHCAAAIYRAFNAPFKGWFQDKILEQIPAPLLRSELESEFGARVDPAAISCTTVLEQALWGEVLALMVGHFLGVALNGWQFERFEKAWCRWLEANAVFDWSEEHLQERVEAILTRNLLSEVGEREREEAMCRCAAEIVKGCGAEFHEVIREAFQEGKAPEDLPEFIPSNAELCADFEFDSDTAEQIQELLQERYNNYKEVSQRLWMVVDLLGKLKSSYPPATLHDFDEGDDENPVRLGKTALGS